MTTLLSLSAAQTDTLLRVARSGEAMFLVNEVLMPWQGRLDVRLRTATAADFPLVQGQAQVVEQLIELLTQKPPKPATRRLVVDGESQEFGVSGTKPRPGQSEF